jgi:hypothetical protein
LRLSLNILHSGFAVRDMRQTVAVGVIKAVEKQSLGGRCNCSFKKKWTAQDDLSREVCHRYYNKWFMVLNISISRLINLFFGLYVKSALSTRSFFSQNWVLDRRWHGYLFVVFIL